MRALVFVVVYAITIVLLAEDAKAFETTLIGQPVKKASCDAQGCNHEQLVDEDQVEYEMVISRSGNSYYWTSREGKKLSTETSGMFTIYKGPSTSGYIKTSMADGNCLYMEHIQLAFQTITYWGLCQEQ